MTPTQPTLFKKGRVPRPVRVVGYAISIGINLVLIWVVANLVEWDILPFLTEAFDEIVPIAIFSMVVGIAFYVAYLVVDPPWLRILGDTVNSAIALAVIVRTYQVFPFEFEGGFWTGATRIILIVIGVATAFAALVNLGKLVTGKVGEGDLINKPSRTG